VDPDDQDAAIGAVEIGIVVRTDGGPEFARGGIEKRILFTIDDGTEVPAVGVRPVAGGFANGSGTARAPVSPNDLQETEPRAVPDMLPGIMEFLFDRRGWTWWMGDVNGEQRCHIRLRGIRGS
jgi:hypothetical protein